MECKLTITVDTHEDNSLNVSFDGSFLGTKEKRCIVMASIADALGMDAIDMLAVGIILKAGLPKEHITGEKIIISTRQPKEMEDDD